MPTTLNPRKGRNAAEDGARGPRFGDIPQLPRAFYEVDVAWAHLEEHLTRWATGNKLDLHPDYQRKWAWRPAQQVAFVEYQLRGGEIGRNLTFNSPDWFGTWERPTELVDGMQRLEAVRAFLRGDIPAFGHYFSEYTDKLTMTGPGFKFRVCKIESRADILQMYLNINGGTPHAEEELAHVRKKLVAARAAEQRGTTGAASKPRQASPKTKNRVTHAGPRGGKRLR